MGEEGIRAIPGLTGVPDSPANLKNGEFAAAPATIRQLLDDLKSLERRISQISQKSEPLDAYVYGPYDHQEFHTWVKTAYTERQARRYFFKNPHVLGEPCWDIILDLTKAELEGKRISITSACIASGVPPTTALRWIAVLEKDGIVERSNDVKDKRRMFIRLSDQGMRLMFDYYKRIRPNG